MKRSLVLFLDLLLVVVSLAAFSTVRDKPALPMHVFASHAEDPHAPFKTGKSPGPLSSPDDRFLIDGQEVSTQSELEFVLDRLVPGDRVDVQFEGSWSQPRSVALVRYYSNTYFAAHLLVGLTFFFLGLLVYFKRPDDNGALYCHWSTVSVGVAVMTTWGHYEPQFDWTHVIRYVFAVAYCVRPVILVHFTLVFPIEKVRRRVHVLAAPYGLALALAAVQIVTFANAVDGDVASIQAYTASFGYAALFSMILSLGAVASFIHSYFIAREYSDRRKLRWTLTGFGAALISYVCLWQIPTALKLQPILNESTMLLSTLIAPVTFTIAILRYNLFDIDHILSRASTYVVVLGVTFLIYALILGTLGRLLGQQFSFTGEAFAYICAIALIGVLLEPVRSRVQNLVDKQFFRVRYDMRQAQKQVHTIINEAPTRESLLANVKSELERLLQPRHARTLDPAEIPAVAVNGEAFVFGHKDWCEPGARFEPRQTDHAVVLVVQAATGDAVAAIGLGAKRSGKRYRLEDIDLLEYTAIQVSLVYERLDLMQALVERQMEAQRLQEISEFKSRVLNSVSHDLKTPITSIKMYAQLIGYTGQEAGQADVANYVEIIRGESDRLTSLIDNVLDHARLEHGKLQFERTELDVNVVIARALQTVEYLLALQGFETSIALSASPLFVLGDETMLHNVMLNLISNAMKYSSGNRYISVSSLSADGFAVITIEDRGIGIGSQDLERIFEPFYRVEGQRGLQAKGVGLGLSNVRSIIEAHSGSISVVSELDQGSTFTIRLPLV